MAQALSRTALQPARRALAMIPRCSGPWLPLPVPASQALRYSRASPHEQDAVVWGKRHIHVSVAAVDAEAQAMTQEEWQSLPRRGITATGRLMSDWNVRTVNTRGGPRSVANARLEVDDDGYDDDDGTEGMGQSAPKQYRPRLDLNIWGDEAIEVAQRFPQNTIVRVNGTLKLDRYPGRAQAGKEFITLRVTVNSIARVKDDGGHLDGNQ